MDEPPKIIDGKYQVMSLLGGGGFSEVYLVEGPGGRCALKLLKGDIASLKKSTLDEFKNEFAVLKDMRHPHIASILDFGFDAAVGRYYYTSELIEGRAFVRAAQGMPLLKLTDLVVQALRALSYLHSYRIYHFDIKAANLLVVGTDEPEVKIIDFGLAGIDPGGRLIGTPSYMAPEIVAREHADGRADLYSLGVLWYYAVTGKNPFRCKDSTEALTRQLQFIPPSPSGIVPTVPAWLDSIIMRLIEKNPANRFSSAAAVIREINRLSEKDYPLETRETLLSYLPDEGRFVGREAELAKIEGDLLRVKEEGGLGGALVLGAPGTGKTRLLKELKYRSQLTDVRIEWASAEDSEAFERWCALLGSHLNDGQGLMAFMLDDAHVALSDEVMRPRVLALLARAVRPPKGGTIWIALAARSVLDQATRTSVESLIPQHVEMKPFSNEEMTEYIVSLTGLEVPPAPLLKGLFDRTEGNPLFLTELIKSLIEGGGLFDEKGRWNEALFEDMGVDFSKAAMPETLGGLLLERLRDVSRDAVRFVQALSALPRAASAAELGSYAVLEEPGRIALDLLGRGILDRAEGFKIRFHNALLGQAVYEAMPEEERQAVHDRIAEVIRREAGDDSEALWHESLGSKPSVACDAALVLGERALAQGRGEQAAFLITRALEHASPGDVEKRVEIELKLGEAFLISHDYAAATQQFSKVENLISTCAAAEAMARWRAEVLARIGGTYIKLQAFDRARAAFHDARGALEKVEDSARLAITIENFLGSIKFAEGRLGEARHIFEGTRVKAARLSEREAEGITNNDLGMVLVAEGDLGEAERILKEDLEQARRVGDDLLVGRALYNQAQLASTRGDYDEAIAFYRECIDVCRRSHNTELLLRAYNGLGNAYQVKADPEQSLAFYDRGMALYERTGDLRGGAAIAVNMGVVEAQRGRLEAALDRLVPAVEYLRSLAVKTSSDWTAFARGLLELGDIAKEAGKLSDAREKLEEARSIASRIAQAASLRFWILATMAEVAFVQGREGELSDIMGMLGPLAVGEAERVMFEKLKERCGKGVRPTGQASVSNAEQERHKSVSEEAAHGAVGRYRRILDINKLIAAENDLDYVLKTVLYYALDFTRADAGAIVLLDHDGALNVACERNLEGRDDTVAFSETLARRVLGHGEAVCTDDAMSDERFAREESVCAHALHSILCLPVKARRSVIGVLYLENRFQVGAFASADMVLLDAFTDQVGLAIETARLLGASARKEESLANELAEASRRAEHYEEMLRQAPVEYRLDYGAIAGRSSGMQRILKTLDKIADTEISVFIFGESGTGKELLARALHENHAVRRKGKFVAINCGAIPSTLIESELFGYKAGAFTGAARDKRGLIEEASGGTLFLDEVAELGTDVQVKLLRVLQERECVRLGETEPRAVDVRLIAASNRDIEALIGSGVFREDLYYRICQIKVEVPPLRERLEDIPFLVERFIAEARPNGKVTLSPKLMKRLLAYRWPGNIRELENLIQVLCALAGGDEIQLSDVPDNHPLLANTGSAEKGVRREAMRDVWPHPGAPAAEGVMIDALNCYEPSKSWKDYERVIVAKCYAANDYRARPTAAELDVAPATLYNRVKAYALNERASAVYQDPFVYERSRTLADYLPLIFSAALTAAAGVAKDAIANLRISQGFFYKVMRKR